MAKWRTTKEPGIVQLPSGAYLVRWYDHDGKRQSATAPDFDAARKKRSEVTDRTWRVKQGYEKPAAADTLEDVVPAWLEKRAADRAAGKHKYRPRDDRSRLDTHILPYLGKRRLSEIDEGVIADFIRHLGTKKTARPGEKNEDGRTLRPTTIRNCIILLRKLLADHGHRVHVEYQVPDSGYRWIEKPEDVAKFLGACQPDWFRVAAAIAVYAGLRQGEVAGLRREALDFDRKLVHVCHSYDGPTKSKHVRFAPMAPELETVLTPWLLKHAGELVVTRPAEGPDGAEIQVPIAEDDEGDTLAPFTRRACKRAGVPPVTFHQLRHTFATHAADHAPEGDVGLILGHADSRTTRRYTHRNSESVARQPRLHLSFTAPPDAKVIPLPAPGSMGNKRATPADDE